jgi:hypothetical protein
MGVKLPKGGQVGRRQIPEVASEVEDVGKLTKGADRCIQKVRELAGTSPA